jgi:hypothetical protein
MTKFDIELPADYSVTSRDTFVTVKLADLSPEIIGRLALHGLTQKIADSAAGAVKAAGFDAKYGDLSADEKAKVNEHAKAAMSGVLEALVKGEWTERRATAGVDPVTKRMRVLFGAILRAQAKDVWAALKDADDKDERLDTMIAEQDEEFQTSLKADAVAELKAEDAAKAKVAKLGIGLKL